MTNPVFSLGPRERWLMNYIAALDDGDESALESLLARADQDAEFARSLDEIHSAWGQEHALEKASTAATVTEAASTAVATAQFARGRELAQQHLAPAVATTAGTSAEIIRVYEVAEYLERRADDAEKARLQPFLKAQTPLPLRLTRANLEALARELSAAVDEKFLRRFKDAAITVRMGRTTPRGQMALARQEKQPRSKENSADGQ